MKYSLQDYPPHELLIEISLSWNGSLPCVELEIFVLKDHTVDKASLSRYGFARPKRATFDTTLQDVQSPAYWRYSTYDHAKRAIRLPEPREGQSSSPQMAVEETGHEIDSQGRFSGDASQALLIERSLLNAEVSNKDSKSLGIVIPVEWMLKCE
jgi:hypothetical protein